MSLTWVELGGLEPPTPCLQSMAKMSSSVHGLACSVPSVHLSPATSRPVGVGCGCHRGPLKSSVTGPGQMPGARSTARPLWQAVVIRVRAGVDRLAAAYRGTAWQQLRRGVPPVALRSAGGLIRSCRHIAPCGRHEGGAVGVGSPPIGVV
jgi:hypothetical protein